MSERARGFHWSVREQVLSHRRRLLLTGTAVGTAVYCNPWQGYADPAPEPPACHGHHCGPSLALAARGECHMDQHRWSAVGARHADSGRRESSFWRGTYLSRRDDPGRDDLERHATQGVFQLSGHGPRRPDLRGHSAHNVPDEHQREPSVSHHCHRRARRWHERPDRTGMSDGSAGQGLRTVSHRCLRFRPDWSRSGGEPRSALHRLFPCPSRHPIDGPALRCAQRFPAPGRCCSGLAGAAAGGCNIACVSAARGGLSGPRHRPARRRLPGPHHGRWALRDLSLS